MSPNKFMLLGTAVMGSLLLVGLLVASSNRLPDATTYTELLAQFDAAYPGRGVADYGDNPIADIPKAYAMVLKAEANRCRAQRLTTVPALVTASGNWLLRHADEDGDGIIGWGLPFAWDAYGDGSVNPSNAEYAISTAIVIDALQDWVATDPHAPKTEILNTIDRALTPYVKPHTVTPAGLFPFSLETSDRRYDTFNPSAYLAGEMQRFSLLVTDPERRRIYQHTADRIVKVLLDHQKTDPEGNLYWNYSVQENNANDMAHGAYIIKGLRTYRQNGGRLAQVIRLDKLFGHLKQFYEPPLHYIRAWPLLRKHLTDPARSYDLGMGLYLAATGPAGVHPLIRTFALAELEYRLPDGRFTRFPARGAATRTKIGAQPPIVIQEYQAYSLFGLSYYLYREM